MDAGHAEIAYQLVEGLLARTHNPLVLGSNPGGPTTIFAGHALLARGLLACGAGLRPSMPIKRRP